MTKIIILNWNGWKDTLECLDSLRLCQGEWFAVIADNGSEDESVQVISRYIEEKGETHRMRLVTNGENYGFARGNNEAIRSTMDVEADTFLLLNNDTIVEPDFLTKLESFASKNPLYDVLTPLICYNYDRNIVWNAGGRQFHGMRRYYYADKQADTIKETGHIDVTFLTGCALYFKKELLNNEHRILTEDFFFGEEDFEFCLRMNKTKRKMACVLDSKIYHKVSASTSSKNSLGKIYVHYLNRFIDMRQHCSRIYFILWRTAYVPYIYRLLTRQGFPKGEVKDFLKRLVREADAKNKVTKEDFLGYVK